MKNLTLAVLLLAGSSLMAQSRVGGKVIGTVVDFANENPIAGATIELTSDEKPNFKEKATTNENGEFEVAGLDPMVYRISAQADGYHDRVSYYRQGKTVSRTTFAMAPKGLTLEQVGEQPLVSITVTDSKQNPIEGAEVKVMSPDFSDLFREGTSDAEGKLTLQGFPKTVIQVYAKKKGFRDQIFQTFMGADPVTADVVMLTIAEAYREKGMEPPPEPTAKDEAAAFYNQAIEPYQAGNYEQATELAKKALEIHPLPEAVKMLVYINHNQKQWDKTLKYAEQYLELNPGDEKMLGIATDAARLSNNKDKVDQYREKIREVKGSTPQDLYNEAIGFINQGNDADAKKLLEEILEKSPEYADPYHQLGLIYIREGDFDTGVTQLKYFLKYAEKGHANFAEVQDLVISLSE